MKLLRAYTCSGAKHVYMYLQTALSKVNTQANHVEET